MLEEVNADDVVYNRFDYLKPHHHHILGYVIIPNRKHVAIGFSEYQPGINKIISNAKRFIAYGDSEAYKTGLDIITNWNSYKMQ